MEYPVLEILPELKAALQQHRIVILQAPPGAGKSTVLPLQLLKESWLAGRKMIMLEPRRLAARSVAMRMAELYGEPPGGTIGYRVRFESRSGENTAIEVVTEGILTRKIQHDNALEDTGLVIFDEFHERSLQADLALALTLQVQQVLREDLRMLIMSATLDKESLSAILRAPVIASAGKQYPIDTKYLGQDETTPVAARVAGAVKRALRECVGDILAFLPGAGEIQSALSILENDLHDVVLHPLFGDLPFRKQQEAIQPHPEGKRKVVLATSIAETSLTIEGIGVVIDSGLSRVPRFDPRSGLTRLVTTRVTKDAADQRAGRAGRLGPGTCYRLWSEGAHHGLVPNRIPEILEADLATLVLELSAWGVSDINTLTWVTPPPSGAVAQARNLLESLDAVTDHVITARGRKMTSLPTHPRIAHMLLEGQDNQSLPLATDIAAVLEERDPLPRETSADLGLRVSTLRKWRKGARVNGERNVLERIERLASSWRKIFRVAVDNTDVDDYLVGALIMAAYPERIARQTEKHGERFKLFNHRVARVPDHDPLTASPWIAIASMDAGKGEGRIFLAAPLDEQLLRRHATEVKHIYWDDEREMVAADLEARIGNLVMSRKPVHSISSDDRVRLLCDVVRQKGLRMLGWEEKGTAWQNRVLSLRAWRPEEPWPDVREEQLLARVDEWLAPFLSDITRRSELEKLDADTILQTILPWEQGARLNTLAPLRLEVPSGSNIKLQYFPDGQSPIMEVRLQEVFGLLETPAVNEGRTKVMMHLLSPGFKPVQVTQDLRSFWSNTYAEVRKELRARYPRHSWPEDPWTAKAIRGAVRRR